MVTMRTLSIVLTAGCIVFAGRLPAANNYLQHNLVSTNPGLADHSDPSLINPWGIAFSPTGPFWIADQGDAAASIYNSSGVAVSGQVSLPAQPTGIVQNPTTDFPVTPGVPAAFIFCSAAGTISAWSSGAAVVKIDHSSSGAIYTGLAYNHYAGGSALYAVNFATGTVEVYDANFNPVTVAGSFQDPTIPTGFAPYNIWATANKLYVTFAQQNATKSNPVIAPGSGYVDQFDVNGSLVQRVAAGGPLNAPFGLAIAPAQFGDFAGALLVGNFGDGTVDAFDVIAGNYLGVLANVNGQTFSIPGLRSLAVGNGKSAGDSNAVYFTATGLFGSIQAAPVLNNNGIMNAASFQLGVAPYTFVSIFGSNLAATTRSWQSSDFGNGQLPRSLDGVGVSVNGASAYIAYVSPTQLNVLLPLSTAPGLLQTSNNGLLGPAIPMQFYQAAPAIFQIGSSGFAAATHPDGTLIGPPGVLSSSSRPAQPGEIITMYGNGFGLTNPVQPDGSLIPAPLTLASPPTITIGGQPALVIYAGLTAPGLYQFNVIVPQVNSGNVAVVAQVGSVTTPATMIAVQ